MKKRKRLLDLVLFLAILLGAGLLLPGVRWGLWGYLKGERFYKHRPTSYWSQEVAESYGLPDASGTPRRLAREPSALASWTYGLQEKNPPDPVLPLARLTDGEAVPVLLEMLKDERPPVRFTATFVLRKLGPMARPAIPALAVMARGSRDEFRAAADALEAIGADSLPVWVEILSSNGGEHKLRAVRALAAQGPRARPVTPVLVELLKDKDDRLRNCVLDALAHIDEAQSIPYLIASLKDPATRREAAHALVAFDTSAQAAIPTLVEELKAGDRGTQWAAYHDLLRIYVWQKEAVRRVADLLKHSDPEVRGNAVAILGHVSNCGHRTVPLLAGMLHDPDPHVRLDVINALCRVQTREAIFTLAVCLAHRDPAVRARTALFLGDKQLQGKVSMPVRFVLFHGNKPATAAHAVLALFEFAPEGRQVFTALIAALIGENAMHRESAVQTLSHIGLNARKKVLAFTLCLKDKDEGVRLAALAALQKLGPRGADGISALIEALADRDPDVSCQSAKILGALGPPARSAVPALLRQLQDEDDPHRQVYLDALEQIDPQAVPKAGVR